MLLNLCSSSISHKTIDDSVGILLILSWLIVSFCGVSDGDYAGLMVGNFIQVYKFFLDERQ